MWFDAVGLRPRFYFFLLNHWFTWGTEEKVKFSKSSYVSFLMFVLANSLLSSQLIEWPNVLVWTLFQRYQHCQFKSWWSSLPDSLWKQQHLKVSVRYFSCSSLFHAWIAVGLMKMVHRWDLCVPVCSDSAGKTLKTTSSVWFSNTSISRIMANKLLLYTLNHRYNLIKSCVFR